MTLTLKTNLPGRGPRGFILVPFPKDGREGVSDPKPKACLLGNQEREQRTARGEFQPEVTQRKNAPHERLAWCSWTTVCVSACLRVCVCVCVCVYTDVNS